MTTEEFSNGFDVLLNSYNEQVSPMFERTLLITLDEYEKSVFLTKAQQELVVNLYNGKNIFGDSFEITEELRRYLDGLVKTKLYTSEDAETSEYLSVNKASDSSVFFSLPSDLAFITMEQVIMEDDKLGCASGKRANVYPITQDEYSRVKDNPFRGPTRYKVLRLDYGQNYVELISKFNIKNYLIKYLSKPKPIILVDLPNGLSIENETQKTECSLNSILHQTILERAVTLAVQAKSLGKTTTTSTSTTTTN